MSSELSTLGKGPDAPLRRDADNVKYRPDIDGLRAIAVLSVIFFHVGFGRFGGGWVGVDVFFVISGFLITRLIRDEYQAGTFSFAGFYARRARRLFPSFFFTVAASFIAGSVIFDPVYLQHFAGEVVYAIVAASNFFYWLDGGYFGVAEQYKPLLHTWSLGVEEQFYLIWPLTIVLVLRYCRRYLWLVLTAASLASLFLAEYFFWIGDARAVFMLLPARIFEFAIGAMLVWLVKYQSRSRLLLDIALVLGLALIFVAVFGFTTSTPFPGIYALVPCLGAALAIFGGTSTHLRFILANRLMVGIGKISYSLYLVHWPIIVFYGYHRLNPLDYLEKTTICVGSIAAAALMYTWIEQPFRDPRRVRFSSRAALGLACTAAMLVVLIPSAIVWAKGGLIWRGSVQEVNIAELERLEQVRKQNEVDDFLRGRLFDSDRRIKLMFVGDSHSGDLAAAMFLTLGHEKYDYARTTFARECFSSIDLRPWILRKTHAKSSCEVQLDALRKNPSLAQADYLFIVDRWSEETIKGFPEGLALLRGLTKARIIVVGQNAIFPTFDDSLRFLDRNQLARLNGAMYDAKSPVDVLINQELRTLAATNGLSFIDRQSVVCSEVSKLCQVLAPDGGFLYQDSNHWSYEGRIVFGKVLALRVGNLFASDSDRPAVARQ
jgi:peptidoglycan/LPS O-acetylase OafA/YrhL